MKILFVTGEFPPMQGGVGDYTQEIGLALRDLGCQVHIVSSTQAGPVPGLAVHPVVERWNWNCWRTILKLIERHHPEVVHIQYQAAAYAMHPAINLLPRRLRWRSGPAGQTPDSKHPRTVVTFHDLKVPYLFPKAGRLRRWVVNELACRSDAAITTNRADFSSLGQELGRDPALIPIGSNISPTLPDSYDRDTWRARWGVGPGDPFLCFFGFINDRKGVDTLIHALRIVVSDPDCPVKPYLLFVGGQTGASDPTNAAYLAHIQALIADCGLQDRIRWTGYIPAEEVSASFASADLCVLPFRDGVSFLHGTLHAALVHGAPILTTQPHLPLPELVDGENVCLVPPDQPRALAEAIVHLAGSPELRRTLGAGAKALSQQFRWEKIAADTLELYHSLIQA